MTTIRLLSLVILASYLAACDSDRPRTVTTTSQTTETQQVVQPGVAPATTTVRTY